MKYKDTIYHYTSKTGTCLTALLTTALLASGNLTFVQAGEPGAKESKAVVQEPVQSHVNFLLNVEFANEYVTPRGMIVRDEGLTIQPLLLMFVELYKGDGFINKVKLLGGVWNDIGTTGVSKQPPYGSSPKTNWTEIDPIGGISIGFAKYFTLDATYSAFVEQILSIGTSQNLEIKLSFDDSDFLKAFALHPYFSYWMELDGKATDADVPEAVYGPSPNSGAFPQPGPSYYFEFGLDPSYTFKNFYSLKFEAPCRLTFPNKRFYGQYYGSSTTVGLYELGVKASLPLDFMPKGYGNWSFHTGVRYQHFVDNNLYNLNTFNAPGGPKRDTWQVYGGVTIFF